MDLGSFVSSKAGSAVVYLLAAVLEVAGDALIRKGMRGSGLALIAAGFAVLGSYGVVVNLLNVDFSRLLGAYVGVFAVVSVLIGRFAFQEAVPGSTWLGLGVILCGSLIIHLGRGG
jgi:small multidrug resistance family-3 protein